MNPSGTVHLFHLRGGEAWRNPFPDYKRLRDLDPVHRVDHPDHACPGALATTLWPVAPGTTGSTAATTMTR